MAAQSLGYGDYRDRDTSLIGSGVDAIPFPPPFPPLTSTAPASSTPHSFTTSTPSHGLLAASPSTENVPATISPVENFFGSMDRFGRFVVSISRVGVVHCLAYPYVVFSRQCQVYPYNSIKFSLVAPLSTTAVLYRITHSQGVSALWRGWKTNLQLVLVKPLAEAILLNIAASKNVLLAVLLAPVWFVMWALYPFRTFLRLTNESDTDSQELSEKPLLKRAVAYIFVKGVLQASLLPLVSYCVTEMVQHTGGRGSSTLGQFTLNRPLHTMDKYRRIPYLHLFLPSLLHEVTTDALTHVTASLVKRHQHPANDAISFAMNSLWTSYLSSLVSEAVLYPLETVLLRLYCQGMPGLVDNVQTGSDVMFVSSYYTGLLHCVREVWGTEGVWGFYKGFSSLLLRYALHGALLVVLWRAVMLVTNRSQRDVGRR